jgi:ribonuclease HI
MISAAPHFLMLCEAQDPKETGLPGNWKFVCQQLNGKERIEVSDSEPDVFGERLHLLSVVRGLESLEQPSRVSLISSSRYVGRGIRHSLSTWRDSNWQWEHFGIMKPIKHGDLWRRIDRAMSHHEVECRVWRFDAPKPIRRPVIQPNKVKPMRKKSKVYDQLNIWTQELSQKMAAFGLSPTSSYA